MDAFPVDPTPGLSRPAGARRKSCVPRLCILIAIAAAAIPCHGQGISGVTRRMPTAGTQVQARGFFGAAGIDITGTHAEARPLAIPTVMHVHRETIVRPAHPPPRAGHSALSAGATNPAAALEVKAPPRPARPTAPARPNLDEARVERNPFTLRPRTTRTPNLPQSATRHVTR